MMDAVELEASATIQEEMVTKDSEVASSVGSNTEKQGEKGEGLMTQIFGESDEEAEATHEETKNEEFVHPKIDWTLMRSPSKSKMNDNRPDDQIDEVEQYFRNKKLARKRKPKKDQMYYEQLSAQAKAFVVKMFEASRSDRKNLEEKKQALEKLRLMESVRVGLHRLLFSFFKAPSRKKLKETTTF
ncbi:hypothetical protein RF11_02002 [Thelohanellus kitauei]|uniref:Uncharacterized protein n=1 Tax=Thelohanellus kitauei TaxID=669202 RepID=A0A0C2MLA8_THEKT|nr:hypothetical protein RF11_02002 [Thelohanellus kitauei]